MGKHIKLLRKGTEWYIQAKRDDPAFLKIFNKVCRKERLKQVSRSRWKIPHRLSFHGTCSEVGKSISEQLH
jgi:hypothetical protein